MKCIVKIIIIELFIINNLYCQTNYLFSSQYFLNKDILNPSFAGSDEVFNISLKHRSQWMGLEGSPQYNILSIHWLMKNYQTGIGIININEQIGSHSLNQLYLNYSYRIRLNKNFLSFGIKGGIINGNYYQLNEINDPLFKDKNVRFLVPNFGFGISYYSKDFYAGFSIPSIFSLKSDDKNEITFYNSPDNYYYTFIGGYNYKITEDFNVNPAFTVFYNNLLPLYYNIGTNINYKNFISLGIFYSSNNLISTMFSLKINYQALLGLSYDFNVGTLSKYLSGSLEITFIYQFKYKVRVSNPANF